MKRRQLLAAAAGTAAAGVFAAPAISQGRKQFRLVTSWPKNFPGLGTAPERFARRLAAASDGRLTARVYAGGELVHPLKCHDAVQEGTADMYHSADYYYKGKNAGYGFFTAVPFGFVPDEIDSWVHHGGGQELWDELGAGFNVKHILCGNSGPQMGGWFNKRVDVLDDLRGLKMRIPGFGGDVLNELGGTALTLAGAEIMPALTAGTIDATEWVGPWNDLAFGFYKVTKYYYYPGFHEPGSTLALGVNKDVWDGLPASDQALIEACAVAENNIDLAEFNANNNAALNTLINTHGVSLQEFRDPIFEALGEASQDVLSSSASTSDIAGRIYRSFVAFREDAQRWSDISIRAYLYKRGLSV